MGNGNDAVVRVDGLAVSSHRRPTTPCFTARAGLAFATATALAGGVFGGLALAPPPEAAAVIAPVAAPLAEPAAPARPAAARIGAPVKSATAPASRSKRTSTPTITTNANPKHKAKKRENPFCTENPDRCTGGVPDKKSDRAEYQDDPRSNAEVNSDMPLSEPEGLCPEGYARIAGTC